MLLTNCYPTMALELSRADRASAGLVSARNQIFCPAIVKVVNN